MSNLAIAYSMKKKAKKMAKGSEAKYCAEGCEMPHEHMYAEGGKVGDQKHRYDNEHGVHTKGVSGKPGSSLAGEYAAMAQKPGADKEMRLKQSKSLHSQHLAQLKTMADPNLEGLAHGGDVKGVHHQASGKKPGTSVVGASLREQDPDSVKMIHEKKLDELKEMPKANIKGLAEGGDSEMGDDEMVSRIMKRRSHMYSEGGKVANEDLPVADFEPNDFDDLVLDDHLEDHSSAGNEHGDKYDADHEDLVSRIMMKRKKDRLPDPA